jgi:hypothetical protein
MTAAPFDTLKLTKALREKAHFTQEQAEGLTEALSDSFEEQIATSRTLPVCGLTLKGILRVSSMRSTIWTQSLRQSSTIWTQSLRQSSTIWTQNTQHPLTSRTQSLRQNLTSWTKNSSP